jgi:hypothetical protein
MAMRYLAGRSHNHDIHTLQTKSRAPLKLLDPGVSDALSNAVADTGILTPIPCRHG